MAVLLDDRAWTRGDSPDKWPRSRYSGAALYPGQMVVTVIVSWKETFGHSFIAFEWYAGELPGPRTQQRCHEVYHLVAQPTEAERARGIAEVGCGELISWRARPAVIAVETVPQFFPLRGSDGGKLPAFFRSWQVSFADGWRARCAAAAAVERPHRYNYLELDGGKNCARWVIEIAALSGIDARHRFSSLVAVPKCLVTPTEAIDAEGEMWQRRKAETRHGYS